MARKVKYLSNTNLLREIHISKNNSCYFLNDDTTYEFITDDPNEFKKWFNEQADTRFRRKLLKLIQEEKECSEDYARHVLPKYIDNKNPLMYEAREQITPIGMQFRVMTNEHIPEEFIHENYARNVERIKFPAFKQYEVTNARINRLGNLADLEYKESGRSHWTGGFENGHFINEQILTPELGKMLLLLVNKIGTKGNFCGYTYLEEMKGEALAILCDKALLFNEFKTQNPFAYYTQIVQNGFKRILNSEKKHRDTVSEKMHHEGLTQMTFNEQAALELEGKSLVM